MKAFHFEDELILENGSVLLRPMRLEDIDNLLAIAMEDINLLQYSPKQVYTKELLTDYIRNAMAERRNQTRYSFIIYDKSTQCYAGSTALMNIVIVDDRLEIGATWLGRRFQGTGLNTHCKKILLQFAFDMLACHRVEFRTDERNLRSRRAIEKIGGKQEGILREHMLVGNGFRRNTVYYSILKKEWNGLKDC